MPALSSCPGTAGVVATEVRPRDGPNLDVRWSNPWRDESMGDMLKSNDAHPHQPCVADSLYVRCVFNMTFTPTPTRIFT